MTLAGRRASASPALPGARSQPPPQARLQPVTRPLCSLEVLLLFPIIALLTYALYLSRIWVRCQDGTSPPSPENLNGG